ncbi:GNAT family N-acetyltransferase [Actinomyces slackii]|uniref:Acetyltransferase (GNAT) family n=1 Tax=Actinomyces slackii TaxID=52774 RepID=A0A3S4SLH6_9ACTO|nr:Acetyltransferase (GNAT) family [Actinomyces slackii]
MFTASPIAGLDARAGGLDARAGGLDERVGASGGPGREDAQAGFVRPARAEDLPAMGRVHAATMLASLEAAHDSAHGAALPQGVRDMIAAPVITAGWQEAVTAPPSPAHHVLVSTQGDEVVGLLGLAPTRARSEAEEAEGAEGADAALAAEVTALGVDPAHQARGHGSRLLAAAVDLARQDGAQALVVWAVRGDESLTSLLRAVGMAPTGARRDLPVGQGITEECWAAAI